MANAMSIDLLSLVSHFRRFDDRENANASFRTRVPWLAPEAYLNIVYRPAPAKLLSEVAKKWSFPPVVVDFLNHQNGAMLFSGSLNVYGVVEPSRLLNREDRFSLPPFNIEPENKSWSVDPDRLLVVGGYTFDGSRACIDRSDGQIHVFQKGRRIPKVSWSSLDSWLAGEVARLRPLFDDEGKRTGPESDTGPPQSEDVSER
jgi:hypothetical protein